MQKTEEYPLLCPLVLKMCYVVREFYYLRFIMMMNVLDLNLWLEVKQCIQNDNLLGTFVCDGFPYPWQAFAVNVFNNDKLT